MSALGQAPALLPVSDATTAYLVVHERVDALLRGRKDVAELPVPACPGWTIRQVVAHLTGVAEDIVALNLEKKGTGPWADDQVNRLGERSVDDLLDLWAGSLDIVSTHLTMASDAGVCQLVFDTLTHEQDIRGALGEPGSRSSDLAYEAALSFLTTMGDQFIRQAQLTPLHLSTPAIGSVQLGDPGSGGPQLRLEISDFETLRAFGGRRSIQQILALPWDGDPAGLIPAFTHLLPAFTDDGLRPPLDDLLE